jgi:tRNA1Val (adenine37-N6)-methyltransferase
MMFAQKNNTDIDVIEINQDASQQAIQNISLSDWKDSIHVKNTSLQLFSPVQQYDFIFSNPPFFENDLKSADEFKNSAKHDTELSLDFLFHFIAEHIATNGKATVLLPFHRTSVFEQLIIENGMYVNEKLLIKQSVKHDFFRSMLLFSKIKQSKAVETEISIRDDQNEYTQEFKELLKDYYLAF